MLQHFLAILQMQGEMLRWILRSIDTGNKSKKIGLRKDGDKYYFNRGWSQFARMNKLSDGDIITFNKFKRREGIPEARDFMVGVTKNK
jgi:hypothetical protein